MAHADVEKRSYRSAENENIEITGEEWNRMTLAEKWKACYNEQAPPSSSTAQYRGQQLTYYYFWFTLLTEIYVMIYHIIPHYFPINPRIVVILDVSTIFVATEMVLHWFLTRWHTAKYTRDGATSQIGSVCEECPSDHHVTPDKSRDNTLQWGWCAPCKQLKPPRAHHCKICRACILKREHHCWMTGVCVGFNNQRFFLVLNLYVAIASWAGMLSITWYLLTENLTPDGRESFWNLVLPVTVFRWLCGGVPLHHVFMICNVYTLWWTGTAACGFLFTQLSAIAVGKTSYEEKKNIRIRSSQTVGDHFRSVFGEYGFINFLIPITLIFGHEGDGVKWDYMIMKSS